tara:strand:- start:306 stop:554 length:249 start_codon:yes stop_codon:yes gene_type:complete
MNLEQCVDIMKKLSETYMGTASAPVADPEQTFRLAHALTEIEMYIITMRKSIQMMKEKINPVIPKAALPPAAATPPDATPPK